VKRSLVLTAAPLLVAAVLCAVPASAQSPAFIRGAAEEITSSTTPARDRTRPYTFTTTGTVVSPPSYCTPGASPLGPAGNCVPVQCPAGTTNVAYCNIPTIAIICSGVVNVRFQKLGITISSRNVTVQPNCTFRSEVSFTSRSRLRRGLFSVRSRFQGNLVMRPRTATTDTVRAG
jgi:hypothetical protein